MMKLDVDLDLLLESFTLEKEGVCREYLDTITGEIINIPLEVSKAIKNDIDVEELEAWQKFLLEDAKAIDEDNEGRFLIIPTIKSEFNDKLMSDFINNEIKNTKLKESFIKVLEQKNPIKAFRSELYNNPSLLDPWHDYEEQKLKEYIKDWLLTFDIKIV